MQVGSNLARTEHRDRPRTRDVTGAQVSDDKLAARHEITDGVAALVTSEAWRAMLATAARFHTYSLGNLVLIGAQRPDATRVAGFHTWGALGRQVRKGEKGIAILPPCTYRAKTDAGESAEKAATTDEGKDGAAPRRLRGFRVAYVFDVAQTDGEPLPEEAGPQLLAGEAPEGLWDALAAQMTAHGYTLERGSCGGANGYTDPTTGVVRVRDDVDDAQAVETLAHEFGHIECGHVTDMATYRICRDRCEVEAGSVAYVVAAAHGLDASGYTFAYVAGWAGGTSPRSAPRPRPSPGQPAPSSPPSRSPAPGPRSSPV